METPESTAPDFSSAEWDKVFKPLLFDLGRRKCVLLLGPELARKDGRLLREALWSQLEQNHSEDIAYIHERDNLLLFNNNCFKITNCFDACFLVLILVVLQQHHFFLLVKQTNKKLR